MMRYLIQRLEGVALARPNLNPRFWDSVFGSSNHVLAGDSRKRILTSPQPLESPFDPNDRTSLM